MVARAWEACPHLLTVTAAMVLAASFLSELAVA